MATSNQKLFDQAARPASGKQENMPLLHRGSAKPGRDWPLSSLARSVRNTTAVIIDAVMGRYDR